MQTILSIDASVTPARACVVEVSEGRVQLLEEHSGVLDLAPRAQQPVEAPQVSDGGAAASPVQEVADTSGLPALLAAIKTPYTNTVLLVPPPDYTSLNV